MSPGIVAAIVVLIAIVGLFVYLVTKGRPARVVVDEAAAALRLPISTTKVGQYRVTELINQGQFSMTYAGRGADGAPVTIKMPSRASVNDPDELKRFERESQMLDSVQHPNILRKLAEGRVDDQGRKVPYMILEAMAGTDFGDYLAERSPVSVPEAVRIMVQIVGALEAIHARDIVHRNLSPEALRIGTDGKVTIYNFGVARAATMETVTIRGQIVGTVEYIAPELINGRKVDGRADLYAVGVLGYRLLTGKSPFVYANIAALVKQKGELEGPHARKLNEQVPADLDRLISQLMSADPNKRPGPASTLKSELERI